MFIIGNQHDEYDLRLVVSIVVFTVVFVSTIPSVERVLTDHACVLQYAVLVLRRPISKIPGPWYSKWTGTILTYHWLKGQRTHYVHSLHQQYGPTVRLSPREIGIVDIDDVKNVYHLREKFVKSSFYTDVTVSSEPNMFNTANVQYNRRLRRLLGGPMSDSSISKVEPTVASLAALAILRMEEEMNERGAADVLKWWTFMATDVIGTLTFGESFKTLEQGQVSQTPIYH